MRLPPSRVILPAGELRRFRLPDALGEVQPAGRLERHNGPRLAIAMGWAGLLAGCWLTQGSGVDPGRWLSSTLTDEIDWQSDVRLAQAGIGPDAPTSALQFPGASSVSSAPGLPQSTPTQVETQATATPVVSELGAGLTRNLVDIPTTVRSQLPPVEFRLEPAHGGGLRAAVGDGLSAPSTRPTTERNGATAAGTFSSGLGQVKEQGPALPELLRGVSADNEPWALKEPKPGNDPFEEDFQRAIALHQDAEPHAVQPQPLAATQRAPRGSAAAPSKSEAKPPPQGASAIAYYGAGCEQAFSKSEQKVNVGRSLHAQDVSSEQYASAVSRVDILPCHPRPPAEVQVCAAISAGQAIGITVRSEPGDAALSKCVVEQIRRLKFPLSPGVDLVRTRLFVD